MDFEKMMRDPLSRRAFMARLSAAGLGAVALPLLAGCGGDNNNSNPGTDVGLTPDTAIDNTNFPRVIGRTENEVVLNYALTLEILEANLYLQALNKAAGITNLQQGLAQDPGTYTLKIPAGGVNNAAAAFAYLVQFAYVEATHRDFLTSVLKASGAPTTTGNAAGYAFPGGNPGDDLFSIVKNIYPLEETGVRAYLGAVPFLTSNAIAQAAASIYSTEARHSAALAYNVLGGDPTNSNVAGPGPGRAGSTTLDNPVKAGTQTITYPHPNTFEYYATPSQVLTAASNAYYVK